jgi:hypothetical protein
MCFVRIARNPYYTCLMERIKMKMFKLTNGDYIVCESKSTRNGFKHVANLLRGGYSIAETKICYLNRTWESFEYESVINKLIELVFKDGKNNPDFNVRIEK